MRTALAALLLALGAHAADLKPTPPSVLRVAALEQDPPLDRGAFQVQIDGSPAKILNVRGPGDDLILILALDMTGDISLVDTARTTIAEKLRDLPPNTWVAVVKSQDLLQVMTDPTPDREKSLAAIQAYSATGRSGLLETLEDAMQMGDTVLRRSSVRVAVLYLTDSNVYNTREDFTNPVINSSDGHDLSRRFPDQLIREKMRKLADVMTPYQAPFFFVHLRYATDPINESYQRGLFQVAEESGGTGVFCRSQGDIPASIERVLTAAQSYWSLAVELPAGASGVPSVQLTNGDRELPSHVRYDLRK